MHNPHLFPTEPKRHSSNMDAKLGKTGEEKRTLKSSFLLV